MKTITMSTIFCMLMPSIIAHANDRVIRVPDVKRNEVKYFHKHWKESIDIVDNLISNPHCDCSGVEITNAIEFLEINSGIKVKIDAGFVGLLLLDIDDVIVKWKAWYEKNKINIFWEGKYCVLGNTCKTDLNTARYILE